MGCYRRGVEQARASSNCNMRPGEGPGTCYRSNRTEGSMARSCSFTGMVMGMSVSHRTAPVLLTSWIRTD